jgi:hypothetical protein
MSGIFDAPDQNVDQLVDIDPTETAEWQASFDAALEHAGPVRARYLMLKLLQRAHEKQIALLFATPITSTQFHQNMNLTFQAMKPLSAVSVPISAGMLRCWCTEHNVPVLVWVDIFQRMHPLHRYMKLVSTTSSAEWIIQVAEIKSFSKVMPAQECMRVLS